MAEQDTPRRRWPKRVAVSLALLALAVAVLHRPALGISTLDVDDGAPLPESSAELEQRWDAILDGAVQEGQVDYGLLSARRASVQRFAGTLARFGPATAPEAFASREARFAYFLNAYNAIVVASVLHHDVRDSVQEVRGWLDVRPGLGFFWGTRFTLDGEGLELHALENDVLRPRFGDARLHAAINCASASCPRLSPHAYHGATLDSELDAVARELASAPHVVVGDDGQVVLNSIYDWYRADFEADAPDGTLLGWIREHSDDPAALERAREAGAEVRFADYDWRLNGSY